MKFTDNDLAQLENINNANRNIEGVTVFPVDKITALLSRLKMAENVVIKVYNQLDRHLKYVGVYNHAEGTLLNVIVAWQKAAGK